MGFDLGFRIYKGTSTPPKKGTSVLRGIPVNMILLTQYTEKMNIPRAYLASKP